MSVLYLDIETFNTVPITHGTYRYAKSAEVMLVQWAWDDEDPVVWDLTRGDARVVDLQAMVDAADRLVIHNSPFERLVLREHGVTLPLEKIDDTMVIALLHGLLGDLGKLCDILGVPQDRAKVKDGKKLINLFTSPCPKNWKLDRATRETHPEQWAAFVEYARMDIISMREVFKRLPKWNWTFLEQEYWRLDQRVNDRGFAVDRELAEGAIRAFDNLKRDLAGRTRAITGGAVGATTERDKLLAFLNAEGCDLPDVTKATVECALEDPDLPPLARELLEIREQASRTTPSKYTALIRSANDDGRLRGTLQFSGASRTGRDAGRIFQPQNLVRTPDWFTPGVQATVVAAFKERCEDLLFGNIADMCAFAVRGSLVAEEDNKLVAADLANIEGRALAWLAGEEWKLDAFAAYDRGESEDMYKITAGRILGKDPKEVTKEERQRIGKVSELSCGFQGSVGAFRKMGGKMAEAMDDDEILAIVRPWRKQHPATQRFWYALEDAARSSLAHPGDSFAVNSVTFDYLTDAWGSSWLRIRLPSGRYLTYLNPTTGYHECGTCEGKAMADVDGKLVACPACDGQGAFGDGQFTYEGVDQLTKQWGQRKTYGGSFAENVTQAVARDVFFHGFREAERAGYTVVLRVHDELVAEVPDTPDCSAEALSELMSKLPLWALGMPVAAEGYEAKRYRKE